MPGAGRRGVGPAREPPRRAAIELRGSRRPTSRAVQASSRPAPSDRLRGREPARTRRLRVHAAPLLVNLESPGRPQQLVHPSPWGSAAGDCSRLRSDGQLDDRLIPIYRGGRGGGMLTNLGRIVRGVLVARGVGDPGGRAALDRRGGAAPIRRDGSRAVSASWEPRRVRRMTRIGRHPHSTPALGRSLAPRPHVAIAGRSTGRDAEPRRGILRVPHPARVTTHQGPRRGHQLRFGSGELAVQVPLIVRSEHASDSGGLRSRRAPRPVVDLRSEIVPRGAVGENVLVAHPA